MWLAEIELLTSPWEIKGWFMGASPRIIDPLDLSLVKRSYIHLNVTKIIYFVKSFWLFLGSEKVKKKRKKCETSCIIVCWCVNDNGIYLFILLFSRKMYAFEKCYKYVCWIEVQVQFVATKSRKTISNSMHWSRRITTHTDTTQ